MDEPYPAVAAADLEEVKRRVTESAFEVSTVCPECGGDGKNHDSDAGRRTVHCFMGTMGADWDEATVLELIDRAKKVFWGKHFAEHDLCVVGAYREGESEKVYTFQVKQNAPAS